MPRLLIVDDHEVVRIGLRAIFSNQPGFTVAGEAATARESVELAEKLAPDIIIMDVRLPDGSGIEACRIIREKNPSIKIIVLTSYADEQAIAAAIMAGANGYVLKKIWSQDLIAAVERVAGGETLLDPELVRKTLSSLVDGMPVEQLTPQERKILALIGEAKTNRQIAEALFLSEKTVRNYVSNILHKLNLSNRAQAALFAQHYLTS